MKLLVLFSLVVAGIVAAPGHAQVRAAERLKLQVTPAVAIAPAWVRIRALVEHDAENRAIEIVADSEHFFRRSVVQLDGEAAPKVNELLIKDAPGGFYDITVTLFDARGSRAVAHQSLQIVGSGADERR